MNTTHNYSGTTGRCLGAMLIALAMFTVPVNAQQPSAWSVPFEGSKAFIENRGQFYVREKTGGSATVLYGYDNSFSRIFFRPDGVTFNFTRKTKPEKEEHKKEEHFRSEKEFIEEERKERAAVLQLDEVSYTWQGANPDAAVIASEKTADYFNYSFYSGGKEKSEYYIPGYKKLLYKNLYPHIDVEYTFHPEQGIKYTLFVHPGGDVSKIKMVYTGKTELAENGDLLVATRFGNVIDHAPLTFYKDNNAEQVSSQFVRSGRSISFAVGAYDHSRTLVIDPWTVTPTLTNSNKVWETETSSAGDAFAYGGDSFIKLIKYNAAGAVQWTYTSPWDSANYWIGGFITHPNGESYMTSGSNGEIRKITTTGTVAWSNNPNGLTSYEYWSLAFNCDLTKLVVGGTRVAFSIPTPIIRGVVININLATGAQAGVTVVGYGSTLSIPPSMQEVSSICFAPNNNFYFLTLDTIGSINNALSTINFKAPTSYAFDYYIPGYGFGTKQPISAIRADGNAVYTINGSTLHKRNLSNGTVMATATITGGSYTSTFFGRGVNNNGGIDIDAAGNIYVGTTTGVQKFDAALNAVGFAATTFAVYDVDVNANGEVIACGWSGGVGRVQSISTLSAGAQMSYICSLTSPLSVTSSQTNVTCNALCNGTATVTASGGTSPYTYSWAPSGGNAATATGLCAGTYTCTITDNVGATTTASFNITQPAVLAASASAQTNISCNGGTNGAAAVSVTGGTSAYSYNWTPGNPTGDGTNSVSGLTAGSWTCTVTDANGCTATQTFNITQPNALVASALSQTNALCNGGATGAASVSVTGGTSAYTYDWTPGNPTGDGTSSVSGLTAGSWTCTVTDANGCTTTQTFNITQPGALLGTMGSATPATCGNNNGSVTVTASGGTTGYTYSWAPTGGTNATASGLAAGSYTVTITDANNCTTTAIATIPSQGGPTVTVQSTGDVSCFGGNNGSATVSATGNGPFTYAWAPSGGTNPGATNLTAGTYTVTVTDASNCPTLQTITINEPAALSGTTVVTNATCGNSDGSITVTPAGGTGAYTYNWLPSGGSNATTTNIPAGTYTVTITDANSCTVTVTASVANSGGPVVSTQALTDVSCFGGNNGSATVTASGSGPFTYAWAPSGGNAATANNLTAGTYSVTVTDNNGCSSVYTIVISEPVALTASATSTAATCGNPTGTATAVASGGTGPYTYAWSNSQTTATATALAGGSYTVTVTDANGCSTVSTVVVANTGAPVVSVQSSTNILCAGGSTGSATVNATGGTSPYTYAWSPSGGTNATANNLTAGTYTVTVTGSDGCSQTQTLTLTEPPAIQAVTAVTDEQCANGSGSISATVTGGTPGYTYSWSNGATTATISGLSAGSYTLMVTDGNGCTQAATAVVNNTGSAVADAGTSVTIQLGQSTTLNGSGGTSYSWLPGTGLSCGNCASPVATPTVTTTYTLTIVDSLGCTDSDTVTVFVDITCGDVFVPTAFSPNGDQQNDVLYVYGNCITELQFDVYNRWGEKVFSTTNPQQGWDGTWRDKPCEAAVFTYLLRATLVNGNSVEEKGNISLVK